MRQTVRTVEADDVKTLCFRVLEQAVRDYKQKLSLIKKKFKLTQFYIESKAAIIVYSLEENNLGIESFKHLTEWYKDIEKYCGEIPVIIFANKVDLIDEDNLDDSEIQKLIKENNFIGVYRTSAKTGKGVTDAFQKIIKVLHNQYKNNI